jgi:hypothetical protein
MRNRWTVTSLVLLLAAGLVAGCQNRSGKEIAGTGQAAGSAPAETAPPSPSATPADPADSAGKAFPGSTGVFDARIETAFKFLMSNITGACIRELSLEAERGEIMECLNTKTISALEPSGRAVRHCRNDTDVEASLQCTLVGALLIKLREDSGSVISDNAWKDIEVTLGQEMAVVAVDEAMTCTKQGQGEGEAARICFADRLMDRFDVPQADGRACLGITDEWDFSKCLGEAGALGIVESAAKTTAPAS